MTQHALLEDRAVLFISGEDARDFLQGIISNDIRKVSDQTAVFGSLLSPQGRFLFDFFLIGYQGGMLLETAQARVEELRKRLLMYRLRSKVAIEDKPDWKVMACWNGEPVSGGICYADPRLPGLGYRTILSDLAFEHQIEIPARAGIPAKASACVGMTNLVGEVDQSSYEAHRIGLGVPEGEKDLVAHRSILLEYGYDELHGVDFTKGCYVGQEVTARSKHRAGLRKFIHQVQTDAELPPPGTPVIAGAREIGELKSRAGRAGLAHLNVEEAERAKAAGMPLMAADMPVTARLPLWCKTVFERSEK